MNNYKTKLDEISRSKTPVRCALSDHQKLIQDSRNEGHSLNAIYKALKKEGVEAGKGYSSFNYAIKWLDKNGWPPENDQATNSSIEPILSDNALNSYNKPVSTERAGSPNAQGTSNPISENFRDDRYELNFGGSNHE